MNRHIPLLIALLLVVIYACDRTDSSKNTGRADMSSLYLSKGKKIATATFKSLSTELKKAMADVGIAGAVRYCNLRAMPITDSLSRLYNAKIKRTSDKLRNPANKPTAEEMKILQHYRQLIAAKKPLKPIVKKEDNDTYHFYAPITVKPLCLTCHGPKSDIADYHIIDSLYPGDQATGYSTGDLRGIWSIRF